MMLLVFVCALVLGSTEADSKILVNQGHEEKDTDTLQTTDLDPKAVTESTRNVEETIKRIEREKLFEDLMNEMVPNFNEITLAPNEDLPFPLIFNGEENQRDDDETDNYDVPDDYDKPLLNNNTTIEDSDVDEITEDQNIKDDFDDIEDKPTQEIHVKYEIPENTPEVSRVTRTFNKKKAFSIIKGLLREILSNSVKDTPPPREYTPSSINRDVQDMGKDADSNIIMTKPYRRANPERSISPTKTSMKTNQLNNKKTLRFESSNARTESKTMTKTLSLMIAKLSSKTQTTLDKIYSEVIEANKRKIVKSKTSEITPQFYINELINQISTTSTEMNRDKMNSIILSNYDIDRINVHNWDDIYDLHIEDAAVKAKLIDRNDLSDENEEIVNRDNKINEQVENIGRIQATRKRTNVRFDYPEVPPDVASDDDGNSYKNDSPNTKTSGPSSSEKTTKTQKTAPRIDIPLLLEYIKNLTANYSMDLGRKLEAYRNYSLPPCPAESNETEDTITEPDSVNFTGTIMGKCFVCGLEERGIPYSAHCSEAFASDMFAIGRENPQARTHLAEYRKYCRYMDIPHFHYNTSTDPKNVWGRWTGGCSVRWIDISGVYTQRTCRNRHNAIRGRHFVSKRMAMLEMALQHVDNGCIISPMASLVPLSRGISLFARFHACVCTGHWCNQASNLRLSSSVLLISIVRFLMSM